MSTPDHDVVAVTMFALRPGVQWADFERFSTDLDQAACRFTPVLQRFTQLVELSTVRTWFTRAVTPGL